MISDAYVAGFFDGEGSFSIHIARNKSGSVPRVRLAISNLCKEPLVQIQRRWGGSLNQQSSGVWMLCLNGQSIVAFVERTYQHLLVKRDAAQLAVACCLATTRREQFETALKLHEAIRAGYRVQRSEKAYKEICQTLQEMREADGRNE